MSLSLRGAPRLTPLVRALCLALLVAIFALAAGAASASAATLNVAFDNTSPGASTGSAPFDANDAPGNDSSATNHIVRSHDTITYHWALSANGGSSPNTTVTQTLPAGMEWVNLPAYCLTGGGATPPSSLSADKRTIVCNTGTQGSSAVDLYPTAVLKGSLENGDTLTTSITVASSDPGTASVTSPSVTDTVSAAPRVNLEKQPFYSANINRNGVDGVQISYSLSLLVDNAGGKGLKGTETLAQPLTFVDDLSQYLPGAQFVGFEDVSGGSGVPWSSAIGGGRTTENSAPASGTWTGVQATPGGNVAITVSGADLAGNTVPTKAASGATLPADKQFLATKVISFFVPFSNIPDNTPTPYTNTVSAFDPNSVSGQSNYGAGLEPLADNVVSGTYLKPTGVGGFGKAYGSYDTANGWLTGASSQQSGDGLVLPGQSFYAQHLWDAAGGTPRVYHRPIICDNFDTSSMTLSTENVPAVAGGKPAWIRGTDASRWVVEYTTGGTRGATPAQWNAADGPRDTRCEDADAGPGGWVTDPATLPGGLAAVTSVRMRAITDATGIQYNRPALFVNYTLRVTDRNTGTPLAAGRKVANFMQFAEDADNDGTRTWRTNTYDPQVNNNVQGAVANVSGGIVRISKDTDPAGKASALTGETVGYELQPTVTAPVPVGGAGNPFVMRDVRVVDTIPAEMTYVTGSANTVPASVVVNPNGTTTVTWNLGDLPVNTVIPKIRYQATVKLSAPNGAQEVNRTVISSTDDSSTETSRSDDYTIRVDKVFGIAVAKTTSTPWNEPEDDLVFDLEYVNNASSPVPSLDVIDVLPWNGDDRGATDSSFRGTARVASVTPATATDVVLYAARASAQISNDPKHASNDLASGTTKWCTPAQLGTSGCPATLGDATAVRVRRVGSIPSGEGGSVRIVLHTTGNESGDVYVNDAGLAAGGVTLPAFANPVIDRVVASNLGDFVWDDLNADGIQDPGEPGVEGVKVTLTGTDKDGTAVERSVITDANGKYTFASADGNAVLRSGSYRLTFAKDGYTLTRQGAGSDGAKDSDADVVSGRSGTITIGSPVPGRADQDDPTWDVGLVKAQIPPVDPPPTPPTPEPPTTPPGPPTTPNPPTKPSPPKAKKHHTLSIQKLASRNAVRQGRRVTYTLKVTAARSGNEDAVNERLCDTLPANLTLVTKGGGTIRGGQLCWTIKRLAPGKTVTKRFTVRVDRDAKTGRLVNVATVTDQNKRRTAKRTITVRKAAEKKADSHYVTG